MDQFKADVSGWALSVLVHIVVLSTVLFMGRSSRDQSSRVLISSMGGGTIEVNLVPPGLLSRSPAKTQKPAVPRDIRKYQPPRIPIEPDPAALPDITPVKKKSGKPDLRPSKAPNKRPHRAQGINRNQGPRGQTLHLGFGSGRGPGSGQGTGSDIHFPFPSWIQIVKSRIRSNWRPLIPPVGKPKTYQARVYFQIDRQGHLLAYRTEVSSGSALFDQLIERAIRLSTPFPQLPVQYPGDRLAFDLVFRYTP